VFPGGAALDGLSALIFGELRLSAELDTIGHGPLAAVAGPFADQVALELGNGRE
jgi:hypothetical protein